MGVRRIADGFTCEPCFCADGVPRKCACSLQASNPRTTGACSATCESSVSSTHASRDFVQTVCLASVLARCKHPIHAPKVRAVQSVSLLCAACACEPLFCADRVPRKCAYSLQASNPCAKGACSATCESLVSSTHIGAVILCRSCASQVCLLAASIQSLRQGCVQCNV